MIVPLTKFATDQRLGGATIEWRPKQLEVLSLFGRDDLRVVAVAAGRQGGKSSMAVEAGIWSCVAREDLDELMPRGRTRFVLIAAPSQDQSRELVRLAGAMVEASPVLRALAEIRADEVIFRLPSGARTALRALPASPATVRGLTAALTIIDEAAHINSDVAGWNNDTRLIEALEGSMSVFDAVGKSKLILISTPNGEEGEFFRIFNAARDGSLAEAAAFQAPAWELNPALDTEHWKQSKISLLGKAGFDQEHGAEFVTRAGQFFDPAELRFELDAPAHPEECEEWVLALDPAYHADRFGVAVVGESKRDPGVYLVGALWAVEPQGPGRSRDERRAREDATLELVWQLIEPFHGRIAKAWSDSHDAVSVQEFFGVRGIEVEIVNVTAPMLTEQMVMVRSRLGNGTLRCWPDPMLVEDLRRVRSRSATEAIVLPRYGGGHCDELAALGLAVRAVGGDPHMPVAASVSHQSFGTRSHGLGDAPRVGSAAYYELPMEERYALAMENAGASTEGFALRPRDRGYSSPGAPAWLDSPGGHYD